MLLFRIVVVTAIQLHHHFIAEDLAGPEPLTIYAPDWYGGCSPLWIYNSD